METGRLEDSNSVREETPLWHNGSYHHSPATVDPSTRGLTLPVDPSERKGYCQCSRTCCEVEEGLCECGHRDDDHYRDGGCLADVGW